MTIRNEDLQCINLVPDTERAPQIHAPFPIHCCPLSLLIKDGVGDSSHLQALFSRTSYVGIKIHSISIFSALGRKCGMNQQGLPCSQLLASMAELEAA